MRTSITIRQAVSRGLNTPRGSIFQELGLRVLETNRKATNAIERLILSRHDILEQSER